MIPHVVPSFSTILRAKSLGPEIVRRLDVNCLGHEGSYELLLAQTWSCWMISIFMW